MLSSLRTAAGAKLHRTRGPNIRLPYFYGDRDGVHWRRHYCIGCIGMGYVYHDLTALTTAYIRFSDAGQPHAESQPQAQPAGVRKPAEKETAGDDARSSSNDLWGFEGVAW
jgi:hypothetical protein